jgi:hypothetical protein
LNKLASAAAFATGLAFAPAAGAQATEALSPAVQTADQALAQDGAQYAAMFGVDAAEAAARLRFQEESGAAIARLEQVHRRRLAGLAIEHRPSYRIVVLLTGRKRVAATTVRAGGRDVPVVFRTGARATRAEILAALRDQGEAIRAGFPGNQGFGFDPSLGGLVLMVRPRDAAAGGGERLGRRLAELTGVPAHIRIVDEPAADLAGGSGGIEGGARIDGIDTVSGRRHYCTTGFAVGDGARTAILTAAHCPDQLTYRAPGGGTAELPFIGQWGWSFRDVQVNAIDAPPRPLFYADAGKASARSPTGARGRAATRAGDFVCHRGERTGYSCAPVELTDYAPPGALCGGPCAPTWVTVAGPHCGGGDSGGPVFRGTIAYGIVKGGTYTPRGGCAFYYYMSTDYLPDGWTLLTAPAEAPETLPPAAAGAAPAEAVAAAG